MVISVSKGDSEDPTGTQVERAKERAKVKMEDRLKADLRVAMKARQSSKVATIRMMLAAIDNAGAVPTSAPAWPPTIGLSKDVPRRELSERQIWELLQREAENRRVAIHEYERLGRQQEAEQLRAEVALFTHYLEDNSKDSSAE